jgi:HSP20 family protein
MADIVRWDPSESFVSLRQMMDRLFEDAWIRPGWLMAGDAQQSVAVDVYEKADDVVVTATIPGVRPGDIDISVQGNMLTIRGESRMDEEVNEESFHRRERRFGKFMRQVALPDPVNSETAEAHFENGILKLHLPKADEAKPRRIPISGETAPIHQAGRPSDEKGDYSG